MLASLLMRCTPADLRLILIDPKRVEMSAYAGLPHLDRPVVMDVVGAVDALRYASAEMDRRYAAMEAAGVKTLDEWNDAHERLPRLLIVVDELADLMVQARVIVEPEIMRIGQLGRAAGVHLVLATQYPKSDIITSLITANIPSRLALTTATHTQSTVILGSSGAERLTGAGDALWSPAGQMTPERVQVPWVTAAETDRIVAWWVKADEPRRLRATLAAERAAAIAAASADEAADEAAARVALDLPPRQVRQAAPEVADAQTAADLQSRYHASIGLERRVKTLESKIGELENFIRQLVAAIPTELES
jgi:S-DNA-T family DNA segregation ATPase FtsK/SpoIIIE